MRWRKTCPPLLVVIAALSVAAPASASTPLVWGRAGVVDPGAPAGLACPSSSLCVAVDAGGNAVTSTSPGLGATRWTASAIDPGVALTAVSCPSAQLCVAVDRAGQILTTTNPSGPAMSWQRGALVGHPWASVSCPATSLCVAVGGQDVAFTSDPVAGVSSWTVVPNVDQGIDFECGHENPTGECPPQTFSSVSCPSAEVCQARDDDGGGTFSTDPDQAGGWPSFGGLESEDGGSNDVACTTGNVCLQDCAVGVGAMPCADTGSYDAGAVVVGNVPVPYPARTQAIAPEPLAGVWCARADCFATPQSGGLLASDDPGDAHAWWQKLVASPPATATKPGPVFAGVACPSASLCLGLTTGGILMTGPPPVSVTQARAALRDAVDQPPRTLRAAAVLRTHGYRERWRIPAAGTMTVGWYQASTGTLLARATRAADSPADPAITIRLTRAGRTRLRRSALRFLVRGTLTLRGGPALRAAGHAIRVS